VPCGETPALSTGSQTVCSFTEKNCSYFRHFNPGESSEIFEFTTQKGEALGSRGGGKQFLSQAAEPPGVTWQKPADSCSG
jgi:hypothetical protein